MGFRFRKSVNLGPLRVNLSKSGAGYSFGGKGFRITKKTNGGVSATSSIPGTGISYTKNLSSGQKSAGKDTGNGTPRKNDSPKKPFYKRPWFIVVCVLIIIGAVGAAGNDAESPEDASLATGNITETIEQKPQENSAFVAQNESAEEPVESDVLPEESEPEDMAGPEVQNEEPAIQDDPPEDSSDTDGVVEPTIQEDAPAEVPVEVPATGTEEADAVQTEAPSVIVYVTRTGSKYHYDNNCGNGTYYESTMEEALSRNLEPCEKCVG